MVFSFIFFVLILIAILIFAIKKVKCAKKNHDFFLRTNNNFKEYNDYCNEVDKIKNELNIK